MHVSVHHQCVSVSAEHVGVYYYIECMCGCVYECFCYVCVYVYAFAVCVCMHLQYVSMCVCNVCVCVCVCVCVHMHALVCLGTYMLEYLLTFLELPLFLESFHLTEVAQTNHGIRVGFLM